MKKSEAKKQLREKAGNFAKAKLAKARAEKYIKKHEVEIRTLAIKAGLKATADHRVKLFKIKDDDKPGNKLQTAYLRVNFPEPLKIDEDRLRKWMEKNKPKLAKVLFERQVVYKFDRALFLKMEEEGALNVDKLYGGKNPVLKIEDGTPALYVDIE